MCRWEDAGVIRLASNSSEMGLMKTYRYNVKAMLIAHIVQRLTNSQKNKMHGHNVGSKEEVDKIEDKDSSTLTPPLVRILLEAHLTEVTVAML